MARSIQEIEQELNDNRPENIKMLDTGRTTSVLGAIFYAIAFAINALEKVMDAFKGEVDTTLATRQPSNRQWYANRILEFKGGADYSVKDGLIVWDDTDEVKFTVSRVAVNEVDADGLNKGSLKVKVAKGEVGSEGPLTAEELLNLKQYVEDVKYAGTVVELISVQPDEFSVDAVVYYAANLPQETIKQRVEQSLADYIANLRFDGKVMESEVFEALIHTEGVEDVTISAIKLNDVAITRVQESEAGYIKESTLNPFTNTITYVNNATA